MQNPLGYSVIPAVVRARRAVVHACGAEPVGVLGLAKQVEASALVQDSHRLLGRCVDGGVNGGVDLGVKGGVDDV